MDITAKKQIDTIIWTTQANLRNQVAQQLPPPAAEAVLEKITDELNNLHQSILNYLALHS